MGDPRLNQVVAIERPIVERFMEPGPEWQPRINEVLRKAVGL